jgi:hypothetical protein
MRINTLLRIEIEGDVGRSKGGDKSVGHCPGRGADEIPERELASVRRRMVKIRNQRGRKHGRGR